MRMNPIECVKRYILNYFLKPTIVKSLLPSNTYFEVFAYNLLKEYICKSGMPYQTGASGEAAKPKS